MRLKRGSDGFFGTCPCILCGSIPCSPLRIQTLKTTNMDIRTSSIWIKLTKRGQKKIILGAIYREHSLLRQSDGGRSVEEVEQIARWRLTIKQWQEATKEEDAIVIGDMNLDFLTWDNPIIQSRT